MSSDPQKTTTLRGDSDPSGAHTHERWAHLQILAPIGAGAFGKVYRAWDTTLHREVALKLLPAGSPESMLAEARALAAVDHPGVIRVLGADVHDGVPGLWMDLVPGVNLATRLRESGRLGPREAVDCGRLLADALQAVHSAGLIHRDIKPANVMQRPDGSVVLMDLGTGRRRNEDRVRYAGTVLFTAPEILDGGAETPRSDLYGLGVLLYNLLSGELPVNASSLADLKQAHESETVPLQRRRPDLPDALCEVVDRATARRPSDRFADAAEMGEALAAVSRELSHEGRRQRLTGVAAAVVGLAFIGMVVWQTLAPGGPAAPLDAQISYVGYRDGVAQTLAGSDVIAPGDRLGINVELSASAYLYILNRDETGAVTVMYPLAGDAEHERLAGGERHYLPGAEDDRRLGWTFNANAGEESFVVVASRERLDEFEQQLAALPAVDVGGGLTVRPAGPMAVASLMRGVSGLAGVDLPTAAAQTDLGQLVSLTTAPEDPGAGRNVWIHEMRLRNPGL